MATGQHDAETNIRSTRVPGSTPAEEGLASPHFQLADGARFSSTRNAPDHVLTIAVPAYNEESRLPATLDGLAAYFDAWGLDYRVLVIDDGSRDATAQLTRGRGHRFATVSQKNAGKGAAVRNGMLRST